MADIGPVTNVFESSILDMPLEWLILLMIVLIWKLVWYGIALYKSIERRQLVWFVSLFVCSFVLNDLGLIAIIYLILNKKKEEKPSNKERIIKKKNKR